MYIPTAGLCETLFEVALRYILKDLDFFLPLVKKLPHQIQAAIEYERSVLTNKTKFSCTL